MSICYHVQSKQGIGKKSGKWFGCTTLFLLDQYGNPMTETVWWESKEAFEASDAQTAQSFMDDDGSAVPVVIFRDASGKKLAQLSIHDTVEPLNLKPLLSSV